MSEVAPPSDHAVLFLILDFGVECVQDEVKMHYFNVAHLRDMETAMCIATNVRNAIQVSKACKTERQRQEYRIGLAYCAPPRAASSDKSGMIRRIADFLGVRRGR